MPEIVLDPFGLVHRSLLMTTASFDVRWLTYRRCTFASRPHSMLRDSTTPDPGGRSTISEAGDAALSSFCSADYPKVWAYSRILQMCGTPSTAYGGSSLY